MRRPRDRTATQNHHDDTRPHAGCTFRKRAAAPILSRDAFVTSHVPSNRTSSIVQFPSLSINYFISSQFHSPKPSSVKKSGTNRTSMSPPSLLLLLLAVAAFSSATASTVEETCKSIAAQRPDIRYDFCVASLDSDPSSAAADPAGLAVIAANLSAAEAAKILSKIRSLMGTESDPSRKDCLSACSEVYSDAIDHLSSAVASLGSKSYKDAVTYLSAALDAADDCEEAFDDEGGLSPMKAEDRYYGRLADIALTIAASLR